MVISSHYSVWEPWIKGKKTQVGIGLEILGEIDPQFRFKMHSSTAVKEGTLFTLVRTIFSPMVVKAKSPANANGESKHLTRRYGWFVMQPFVTLVRYKEKQVIPW